MVGLPPAIAAAGHRHDKRAGYGGTHFWIDPKEQVVAVLMSQGPAATRAYHRKIVKALVYQASTD